MYEVSKEAHFSAAHHLRNYHGKCEHMHGHNWRVRVHLRGETLNEGGMLVDFGIVKKVLKEVLETLDHKDINEIPPFDTLEPSAENLARYVLERVAKQLDDARVQTFMVEVWETDTSRAVYRL